MAINIEKVEFQITAQDQATRVFKGIQQSMLSVQSAWIAVGSALAGGAVLTGFLTNAIATRAALEDMSNTTGDSVQTLDGLRRVAAVTGVGMDQLGTSLSRLARNLNSADDDGKAAGRAIEAIGLDIEKLRAKKPGEAMVEIALALNKFEDGAGKVAVAMALMGRSGAQMLPLLKDLAEQGELQGRLTGEQAAAAKELEKNWQRLNLAWQDGKDALSSKLIPALDEVVRAIVEAERRSGSLAAAWVALGGAAAFVLGKTSSQEIGARLIEIDRTIEVAKKQLESGSLNPAGANTSLFSFLVPDVRLGADAVAKIHANIDKLEQEKERLLKIVAPPPSLQKPELPDTRPPAKTAAEAISAGEQLLRQLEEQLAKTGELTEAQKLLNLLDTAHYKTLPADQQQELNAKKNILVAIAAQIDLEKSWAIWEKNQQEAQKAADDAGNERIRRVNEQTRTLRDHYLELIDPVEKYRRELDKIDEITGIKGGLTAEQALSARRAVSEAMLESTRRGNDEMERSVDLWKDFGIAASSSLEDVIFKGGKAIDVVRKLGQTLAAALFRENVSNPLATATSGFLQSVNWRSLFGGGAAPNSGVQAGDWFTPSMLEGLTFGFAGGGSFSAGQTAWVGEEGPELVRFNLPGTVIPHGESMKMGGGDTYNNFTIDARGADAAGLARLEVAIRALNGSIEYRAVNAIANARARGRM